MYAFSAQQRVQRMQDNLVANLNSPSQSVAIICFSLIFNFSIWHMTTFINMLRCTCCDSLAIGAQIIVTRTQLKHAFKA